VVAAVASETVEVVAVRFSSRDDSEPSIADRYNRWQRSWR
jgi:hypothetical protein